MEIACKNAPSELYFFLISLANIKANIENYSALF